MKSTILRTQMEPLPTCLEKWGSLILIENDQNSEGVRQKWSVLKRYAENSHFFQRSGVYRCRIDHCDKLRMIDFETLREGFAMRCKVKKVDLSRNVSKAIIFEDLLNLAYIEEKWPICVSLRADGPSRIGRVT